MQIQIPNLKDIVSRIERLEEEKAGVADSIKAVYAEAKAADLEPAVIRKLIAERKRNQDEVDEEASILYQYRKVMKG